MKAYTGQVCIKMRGLLKKLQIIKKNDVSQNNRKQGLLQFDTQKGRLIVIHSCT